MISSYTQAAAQAQRMRQTSQLPGTPAPQPQQPQGGDGGEGPTFTEGNNVSGDRQMFLELLTTQLQNQSPLDPMKNQQFVQQLATFNTVEQINNLNDNITQMMGNRELLQANNMVGRFVEGVDAQGNVINGEVQRVERIDGSVTLKVGDKLLMLDQVNEVSDSPEGLEGSSPDSVPEGDGESGGSSGDSGSGESGGNSGGGG